MLLGVNTRFQQLAWNVHPLDPENKFIVNTFTHTESKLYC